MSARQPSAVVQEVLAEAGLAHDGALAGALEGIRALRPASAPVPSGALAALLDEASTTVPAVPEVRPAAVVQPLLPRPVKRHRGAMISAIVVAGMGLGATGVAALGGDPFGWLIPDPPAAVSEPPAAAPAEPTPSPALEPLAPAAAPVAGKAKDDGVLPPWLRRAAGHGAAKGAQPTKPAAAKTGQGLLDGTAGAGREAAKDAAGGGLAAAERAASDAAGGAASGAEASGGDSGPGPESGNADSGAEDGPGAGAALAPETAAAEDSLAALRELARVSRGEAPGTQGQGQGQEQQGQGQGKGSAR